MASPDILMMVHSARWLSSCSCQTWVMCSHQHLRHDLCGITCSPHGFLTFIMPLLFDPDCFSRFQMVACLCLSSQDPFVWPSRPTLLSCQDPGVCFSAFTTCAATPSCTSLHFTHLRCSHFSIRGVCVLLLFNHFSRSPLPPR